jgi:hypothetical protein
LDLTGSSAEGDCKRFFPLGFLALEFEFVFPVSRIFWQESRQLELNKLFQQMTVFPKVHESFLRETLASVRGVGVRERERPRERERERERKREKEKETERERERERERKREKEKETEREREREREKERERERERGARKSIQRRRKVFLRIYSGEHARRYQVRQTLRSLLHADYFTSYADPGLKMRE